MLTIYRSNKAEWLAEILGQELRLNPPKITEEVNIIVSTWPSSRWLSEKLSIINNINALVKYPFPGTYLKRLVKRIIGIDPDEKDPWEKNQLVWNILELLPELINLSKLPVNPVEVDSTLIPLPLVNPSAVISITSPVLILSEVTCITVASV